jgi:hypothetical protein
MPIYYSERFKVLHDQIELFTFYMNESGKAYHSDIGAMTIPLLYPLGKLITVPLNEGGKNDHPSVAPVSVSKIIMISLI